MQKEVITTDETDNKNNKKQRKDKKKKEQIEKKIDRDRDLKKLRKLGVSVGI